MRRVIPAMLVSVALAASAGAHEGHTDRAPWDACAASTLGATCQWETARHDKHPGTCREIGGALMCVRNKPIVHGPHTPGVAGWSGLGATGIMAMSLIGAALWWTRRVPAQG